MERPSCPACGGPVSLKLGVCLPCGRPYSAETDAPPSGADSAAAAIEGPEIAIAPAWFDDPTPWRRYFARYLDLSIAGLIVFGALLLTAPPVLVAVNKFVLGAGMLLLWVPVEAALLAGFGTTPGKAMLRLRVRHRDGGSLTYAEALERSGRVWMAGLALGIPVANLVTMLLAYLRLTSHGSTWWDDELGMKVESGDIGLGRAAIAVVLLALLSCLAVLL